MKTLILWLRRDLRLADNPALHYAVEHADTVIPVYIHAPEEESPWQAGAASDCWLHHSLARLSTDLLQKGSRLILRRGSSLEALTQLLEDSGADGVVWNRLYDPATIERDTHVKQQLQGEGYSAQSFQAALLNEPWRISNKQGKPFRVFTPFWKHCLSLDNISPALETPKQCPAVPASLASESLQSLGLLPRIPWDDGFYKHWEIGEQAAGQRLTDFADGLVQQYQTARDFPADDTVSRLSPYLHFGELSPRQVYWAIKARKESDSSIGYIRQLYWREFAHHLLYHFPHTSDRPLDERFTDFPWQEHEDTLKAWQQGRTGIPIVDAGMRELWQTGWMHNRVRMLVASLLCKNLLIPWQQGSRWFWDTLVDADLANNSMGWQWVAGCGADAAPYFRIFNPVTQGERFDPQGDYVRRWLPELQRLPNKWIHQPWSAPNDVLSACNITLGKTYPHPIVDLKSSRTQALAAWEAIKANKTL